MRRGEVAHGRSAAAGGCRGAHPNLLDIHRPEYVVERQQRRQGREHFGIRRAEIRHDHYCGPRLDLLGAQEPHRDDVGRENRVLGRRSKFPVDVGRHEHRLDHTPIGTCYTGSGSICCDPSGLNHDGRAEIPHE
ncbi:unannotated protein [freshwater metagenome]|uniref:Unannotated protein n=1 Tax=freshwater metagenome TaxID=449393 RepID=A0A6J6Q5L3_9ZZZZ